MSDGHARNTHSGFQFPKITDDHWCKWRHPKKGSGHFLEWGGVMAQIGWTNVSGIVSVMTETKHQSQRTTPQNSSAVHYFCNRWRNARTCHATPGRKNSRKQTLGVKRVVGAAWTRKTLDRTFDELLNGSCQVNPVTLVVVLNWFLCRLKKNEWGFSGTLMCG